MSYLDVSGSESSRARRERGGVGTRQNGLIVQSLPEVLRRWPCYFGSSRVCVSGERTHGCRQGSGGQFVFPSAGKRRARVKEGRQGACQGWTGVKSQRGGFARNAFHYSAGQFALRLEGVTRCDFLIRRPPSPLSFDASSCHGRLQAAREKCVDATSVSYRGIPSDYVKTVINGIIMTR